MMKISKNLILSIAFCLIGSGSMHPAKFKILNKSSKSVQVSPIIGPKRDVIPYFTIRSGSEKEYDSAGQTVHDIKWIYEGSPHIYQVEVKVWGFNLGGTFEIKNSGNFSYYFGVSGSNYGIVQPGTIFQKRK